MTVDAIRTFADGLATRTSFALPQRILHDLLDDFVLVSDEELRRAMRALLLDAHVVAEGAGAAPTAAAWKLRERLAGKRVALWVSGANATADMLDAALKAGPLRD
jgi:threonine dehydratase